MTDDTLAGLVGSTVADPDAGTASEAPALASPEAPASPEVVETIEQTDGRQFWVDDDGGLHERI